jgi:hypothetical protein
MRNARARADVALERLHYFSPEGDSPGGPQLYTLAPLLPSI